MNGPLPRMFLIGCVVVAVLVIYHALALPGWWRLWN